MHCWTRVTRCCSNHASVAVCVYLQGCHLKLSGLNRFQFNELEPLASSGSCSRCLVTKHAQTQRCDASRSNAQYGLLATATTRLTPFSFSNILIFKDSADARASAHAASPRSEHELANVRTVSAILHRCVYRKRGHRNSGPPISRSSPVEWSHVVNAKQCESRHGIETTVRGRLTSICFLAVFTDADSGNEHGVQ